MGFSFHSFLVLKLIDCIVFSLANLFEAVNFFWHDFFLLLATLQDAVYFNFINRLNLFSSLSLLGLLLVLSCCQQKKKSASVC